MNPLKYKKGVCGGDGSGVVLLVMGRDVKWERGFHFAATRTHLYRGMIMTAQHFGDWWGRRYKKKREKGKGVELIVSRLIRRA